MPVSPVSSLSVHSSHTPSFFRSSLLSFPSGSYSGILRGILFPGILLTCPNHNTSLSSVSSNIFFPASIVALMATFRIFLFIQIYFLADFSKNPSHLQVIYEHVVYLVSMFLNHIREYFRLSLAKYVFIALLKILLL